MLVYGLQATMRLGGRQNGFAIDEIDIVANDAANAVALAQGWRFETPDFVPDTLMLINPEGVVVWSLKRMAGP